ncbi:hypothetical protein C8J57DRAFT_950777, partial [Mycena rebaudengoi]
IETLDITARNEAIDLWNLQSYLVQRDKRALWCSFVDYILSHFLEVSHVNVQAGQILNIFLQDVHIPISHRSQRPEEIKRMILTAWKYKVKFTALSISNEIKLQMPMWKHPGTNKIRYQQGCHRKAATCLRLTHGVRKV